MSFSVALGRDAHTAKKPPPDPTGTFDPAKLCADNTLTLRARERRDRFSHWSYGWCNDSANVVTQTERRKGAAVASRTLLRIPTTQNPHAIL